MPQGIEIRALGPEDAAVLENVRPDTFDGPIIPKQLCAFLTSDLHRIVVALEGDLVIGMATGLTMLHPDKEPTFFINEVGVHDDYRRRGIGRRLTTVLMQIARAGGDVGVWLATGQDNVAARGLYRDLGARETGGVVVYDWGGVMDED